MRRRPYGRRSRAELRTRRSLAHPARRRSDGVRKAGDRRGHRAVASARAPHLLRLACIVHAGAARLGGRGAPVAHPRGSLPGALAAALESRTSVDAVLAHAPRDSHHPAPRRPVPARRRSSLELAGRRGRSRAVPRGSACAPPPGSTKHYRRFCPRPIRASSTATGCSTATCAATTSASVTVRPSSSTGTGRAVGNPAMDVAFWLPSLMLEGRAGDRTRSSAPTPDAAALAPIVAGYFAATAGLPPPAGAPTVRGFQLAQLEVALPWAVRVLELPELRPAARR